MLAENQIPLAERSVLDRWIISRLHQLVAEVRDALDDYAPDRAARAIERFTIDELSNWYIRRNRRRFWKSENDADKAAAYQTLYESLTTLARLLAPFTPFLAEAIYQNLVRSVDPRLAGISPSDRLSRLALRPHRRVVVTRHGCRARGRRSGPRGAPGGGNQGSPTAPGAAGPHPGIRQMLESVLRLQDQVLDELNVKSLEPMEDPGTVRFVHHPAESAGAWAAARQAAQCRPRRPCRA